MPGLSKVNEKSSPCCSLPESQLPSSAVVVCGEGPSFVHVTVVPGATVICPGLKEKSWIETVISSCAKAAGAKISNATMESMARYSSRFKAPPYTLWFRSLPLKGACVLSRVTLQPLQDFLTYLRSDGYQRMILPPVILEIPGKGRRQGCPIAQDLG